jgi:eukaryotic-like serine/threonine-protein kinase
VDHVDLPTAPLPASDGAYEGRVLADRYVLGELIGKGGMADVFRATDRFLDRDVAVKLFRPEMLQESQEVRAEEEARLSSALSHPGLVMVFDARLGEAAPGEPNFIVMELVDGPTLSQQLHESTALSGSQVAGIGAQIAAGLAHVHAQRLVHRDVKPGNILLAGPVVEGEESPVAKLGDFGIARLIDATRITVTGTTLGTAPYMSPEQVKGEEVGTESDVYSLGLVLLQALTGKVAYTGTPVESALARLSRAPEIPDDLAPEWRDLLEAMTSMEPADRPSSAQVAQGLGDVVAAARLGVHLDTQILPTLTQPATRADRRVRRAARRPAYPSPRDWWQTLSTPARIALVAVAVAFVLAVALVMRPSPTAAPVDREPAYPQVSGSVGEHLTQLQQAVRP